MYLYLCLDIYIYTCIHAYTCVDIHTRLNTCKHLSLQQHEHKKLGLLHSLPSLHHEAITRKTSAAPSSTWANLPQGLCMHLVGNTQNNSISLTWTLVYLSGPSMKCNARGGAQNRHPERRAGSSSVGAALLYCLSSAQHEGQQKKQGGPDPHSFLTKTGRRTYSTQEGIHV